MKKELNILVLGETGVGKSTWINSLLNYISFLTLDEAMKEEQLQWLIPSSFVITTTMGKKLVQQEIKVGDSANEDTTIGNSATQNATPYVIKTDNVTIRLIDTPGIGDTRGTEQDQKNMEGILNTINCYEELHGIVILLKPNDSRIGVMFRFVVQELLTHLHRNAAQNIVFGFTNTRQTHFQPGNTLPSLTKLLSDMASDLIELTTDTVYNFDSESFRFLAAHKQGVDLGNKTDYQKSWERSVEECIRMLSYIALLPPHPITNTATLNASRKLIADLTKPMAEISRLITLNIKMNEEETILLQETNASGAELLKKLKVKRIDLDQVSLAQPVTVCTNSSCIQVRSCGDRQVTNYITRCHDPCYLKGIQTDTVNTAQLLGCDSMFFTYCRKCSHSYAEHMHVLYYYEEVEREVDDESINAQIIQKTNDAERKKVAIASREKLITEYRVEQEKIEKANVKFGFYLKQNSITPYNDARLAYLDHLIKQEENKLYASKLVGNNDYDEDMRRRTQEVIDALEQSRRQYIEYIKILDNAMEHDGSSENQSLRSPEDVCALVNTLYALKHFGKSLRDNKDGIVRRHENAYRSNNLTEVKYSIKDRVSQKWKQFLNNKNFVFSDC